MAACMQIVLNDTPILCMLCCSSQCLCAVLSVVCAMVRFDTGVCACLGVVFVFDNGVFGCLV